MKIMLETRVRQNISAKFFHTEYKVVKNFRLLVVPRSDEAFNT